MIARRLGIGSWWSYDFGDTPEPLGWIDSDTSELDLLDDGFLVVAACR